MNANQEQKTVESIKKVSSEYTPYLALALCWKDQGQTGLFYDKVPASFARHPCDLFDKNGKREEWKYLNEEEKSIETVLKDKNVKEKEKLRKEHFKNLLPEKAEYLCEHIAGGIQVSSFGRVGIPIKCNGENELFKGCKGCALSERTVSIALEENKTESIDKCTKFHFILPQYEKCSWKCSWNEKEEEFNSDYNGYLVVNINGKERSVYELVAEAFKLKEDTLKKMEESNKDFIDYIKEKCGYGDEENLKKVFKELKNADKLQIHHIDNNGHRNTPTYWDENGKMIEGNLIALPDSVHKKIHKIKNFS